jgi:hypothetical protein
MIGVTVLLPSIVREPATPGAFAASSTGFKADDSGEAAQPTIATTAQPKAVRIKTLDKRDPIASTLSAHC